MRWDNNFWKQHILTHSQDKQYIKSIFRCVFFLILSVWDHRGDTGQRNHTAKVWLSKWNVVRDMLSTVRCTQKRSEKDTKNLRWHGRSGVNVIKLLKIYRCLSHRNTFTISDDHLVCWMNITSAVSACALFNLKLFDLNCNDICQVIEALRRNWNVCLKSDIRILGIHFKIDLRWELRSSVQLTEHL